MRHVPGGVRLIQMNATADEIHHTLETFALLCQQRTGQPATATANAAIKRFQITYPDLLQNPRHSAATHLLMCELYSGKDFAERDQQFARTTNTIAKLFSQAVIKTAAVLAKVHALTKRLDNAMAHAHAVS